MTAPSRLQVVVVDGAVQIPTREQIRAHVAELTARVRAHAERGGNQHHVLLDHQDQINQFAGTIPEPQRSEFVRIYNEEIAAATEMLNQEAAAKNAAATRKANESANLAWILLVVVPVFILPMLMRDC